MAANGAATEEKEKLDPEAVFGENELDDSKAKFINGGKSLEDTAVVEVSSAGGESFAGLGKEELKKYAEDPFWVRLRWILFILFWVGWLAMLVSAIVIIVLAPRCPSRPDLKWYHKDASYNVYTKSFFDGDKEGNQDGIGDLPGLVAKQEYIEGLGANTIWLSSIFKSDDKGAVTDYKQLDEKFGSIDHFRGFLKRMMKKGVRVIIDLIPNQTSKNHTWFQQSVKNDSYYGSFYVWAPAANGWMMEDGGSMWTRDATRNQVYLHQRSADMPALNLRNPNVLAEFKDILQYWAGVGVSGFHIVDAEYLTVNASLAADDSKRSQTRNFPDNAEVIDAMRRIVDGLDNKPGREKLLAATVKAADPDTVRMYYGRKAMGEGDKALKGVHMVSVEMDAIDDSSSAADIRTLLQPYVNISASHWLGWRAGSSSVPRVGTRFVRGKVTIAHALQALLPGTPQPYYGDEIGMKNGAQPDNTKYVTPMQWTKGDNAGFSKATPWTPVNSGYRETNVDVLTAQLSSDRLVPSFKALLALRSLESLQFGKTMLCSAGDLLVISRRATGFPSVVAVINIGASPTGHVLAREACAEGLEKGEVVFHSHEDAHNAASVDVTQAVSVGAGEVIVLKFD